MNSWKKVYQDNLEYRAGIVKAVLEDHDIAAIVVSKKDTAYQFGYFEVMVNQDDILKAMKIIQDDIDFK